jgi:hypothetical protein
MQNPRGFRVRRPLWTCPKCGLKFAGKKMAHSCGRATLAEWFAHRMRITDPGELDGQVQRWITRSYRTLGTDGLRKAKR